MENINIKIPRNAKYLSSARLFLSGILSTLNFDIESLEDVKMAFSEGLNIAFKLECSEEIEVEFKISEEKIIIEIKTICEKDIENKEELDLSLTIINCMVDNSYTDKDSLILEVNV